MSTQMTLLSILVQTGLHQKKDRDGKLIQGRNIPAMLQGYPGIGKTQILIALGKEMAKITRKPYPVEVFVCPARMPEEIGGIPVPFYEENEVRCLPMHIGKQLIKAEQGILFFDELSSASQAMGGAIMTTVQDGKLGDLQLPHSVARVAAMNPPEAAANGRLLTSPESNRFCWIDWKLEFTDWADFMRGGMGTVSKGIPLPEKWELDYGMWANGMIISYLQRNLARWDVEKTMPKATNASGPWASPRSWENAGRLFAACKSVGEGPDSDLAHLALRGVVGDGDADAFLKWFKDMDLPDPEELLADPASAQKKLPKRPDKLQVTLESVATAAIQDHKNIVKRWEAAWEVIGPTLATQLDNAMYAAKILSEALQKVPTAKTPKEALMIRDLFVKIGLKK